MNYFHFLLEFNTRENWCKLVVLVTRTVSRGIKKEEIARLRSVWKRIRNKTKEEGLQVKSRSYLLAVQH